MASSPASVIVDSPQAGEDLFRYIRRIAGKFDSDLYRRLLGACNEFKEGDQAQALAAADDASRENARLLLRRTRLRDFSEHPIFEDPVVAYGQSAVEEETQTQLADWTFGELVAFLLDSSQEQIQGIMPGLSSDAIACVVKLMSNAELVEVGAKIFNPLPGSRIGAAGYLSARIQPNSPTDNVQDIQWQVFNGWSFAVGDALLGTNPVSSEIDSVAAIEMALADLVQTFELQDILPHCVLAHIDVQAEVEKQSPGSTQLWFQSLAGVEDANTTFDISVAKMVEHARTRSGRYGLYFETGQGADQTNGHGKGFDMVIHESRKYGFARGLKREVAAAQAAAGAQYMPWVHLNDVAGFIGPEVFRSREQLVRCCLEDIVMGKLHGLTIGLDICSTLHMDVDLDDLDWCIDQIMPAAPAYLMALPTKNDPMLGYLTTSFQDHVRVRQRFGLKVNDSMWDFFKSLGVIDEAGQPTQHFGQPTWVYLQYCRRKGDTRSDTEILAEGKRVIAQVRGRGVPIAEGFGENPWDLEPELDRSLRNLYQDSKRCIWAELPDEFTATLSDAMVLSTTSKDRQDYILHPPSGEKLDAAAVAQLQQLAQEQAGTIDVQVVISDGLNALALTDENHLTPFLAALRAQLLSEGLAVSSRDVLVRSGRVRAGYRIGESLYGSLEDRRSKRAIVHVIGERPGSGHHAFSVYITAPTVETWANSGAVDHNITKVVSGVADTALAPSEAAEKTVRILMAMLAE
ncbi:MAG: ethanolamine ammonia-lyase subunit EutB [bacterium]|nr:ethanolamine ammonia-lyase subunit EutB [bacterium]